MKRSLKALLVSGAIAAALVLPAAPASAATCVGIDMDQGLQHAGAWNCTCPSQPTYGPLDGRFWVILCIR